MLDWRREKCHGLSRTSSDVLNYSSMPASSVYLGWGNVLIFLLDVLSREALSKSWHIAYLELSVE